MAEKNAKYFKTKDGTIVVCKDEVARQQIEQLQGIWEAIEELPDGQAVSAQVAIHTTEIAALQSGKANINGSYDSMTVGMAKNIEAREIVSGIFTHRPTAGNAECATGAAKVRSIKGNSVAWGQMINPKPSTNVGPINFEFSNGKLRMYGTNVTVGGGGRTTNIAVNNPSIIAGHKYYFNAPFPPAISGWFLTNMVNSSQMLQMYSFPAIIEANLSFNAIVGVNTATGTFTFDVSAPFQLFDLTLMFGAGNEPATPEAFEAWLQANVGLQPYYAYNAGKLLATKLLGLRTVWLNQWDEEWRNGYYNLSGVYVSDSGTICSKNMVKVLPNTAYYSSTLINVMCYDANGVFIGNIPNYVNSFTTLENTCYINFTIHPNYGTTYNNDICINLHYTNGRDGEYEPYVEHQYNFDTSKVYGKLNGEGNYVQVFPDGMKSAGSVRDELTIKGGAAKAIKRIGSVDLGTLTWYYDSNNARFHAVVAGYSATSNNLLCAKYPTTTYSSLDKAIKSGLYYGVSEVVIKDTAYTDVATFYSAMNGVMLYYELVEPVEYTDLVYRDNGVDTPIDALNILVSNYGTEEQIVESPTNGEPNSCAATLDILYGVNAADFMDAANNGAFVSKASLDALCNTLGSALGGTLTSTWNSAEGHYDFTFTPATRQIENPENNE